MLPRGRSRKSATVDDLTSLVTLDEASILHALQRRFTHEEIYTSTGAILVAINPFKPMPDVYDDRTKHAYIDFGNRRVTGEKLPKLPPHIYTVADTAFRDMNKDTWVDATLVNSNVLQAFNEVPTIQVQNQSILVSGESGAGKTETTKIIMNYLASVSSATTHDGHAIERENVRNRVLESNPILEAFGNARTNRNNNSSRFGKFIRLGFGKDGTLLGASISTYLLERVRLVSQSIGERNYHIFYELCRGGSAQEIADFGLTNVENYNYLNKTQCYDRRDGVNDAEQFQKTRHAMSTIGMTNEEQQSVLALTAAVLHLGNIAFEKLDGENEGCRLVQNDPLTTASLKMASQLLAVDALVLEKNLCTRDIKAGGEDITVLLSVEKAEITRDVMAKTIYSYLFDWLVDRINTSIGYTPPEDERFIGVVDIFGFEIFKSNSLEQLCINYANEKLQQLFSQFVFEKEQEEYIREAIPWTFVDYPNNDEVVAMFESTRPMGLFALLDEQCKLPNGNDTNLFSTFFDAYASTPHFTVSKLQRGVGKFVIQHYAGAVPYTSVGFCEKNKDHVHTEALSYLHQSSLPLVQALFAYQPQQFSSNKQPSTVVSKFKSQLQNLLTLLHTTAPHFIRCIKPNDEASSTEFTMERVAEQLRCSGVLEAAKISRTGYPLRFSHEAFVHSFICLTPSVELNKSDLRDTAKAMIKVFRDGTFLQPDNAPRVVFVDEGRDPFQVGLTKVFMVLSVYNQLNQVREVLFGAAVIQMQRMVRGWLARVVYRRIYAGITRLQATYRMKRDQKAYRALKHSAIVAQSYIRRFVAQCQYKRSKRAILTIQCAYRCHVARKDLRQKRKWAASIRLQALFRMWLVRKRILPLIQHQREQRAIEERERQERERQEQERIANRAKASRSVFAEEFSDSDSDDDTISFGGRHTTTSRQSLVGPADTSYSVVVEAGGCLGVCFELVGADYVVFRVHPTLSTTPDIFQVCPGDMLVAINDRAPIVPTTMPLSIANAKHPLYFYPPTNERIVLSFEKATSNRTAPATPAKFFDILWLEGQSLGLALRQISEKGPAVVTRVSAYHNPGMINVHEQDILLKINGLNVEHMEFALVCDLMAEATRPLVLSFQSTAKGYDTSALSLLNGSILYHVVWDEGDLGIALKHRPARSAYPIVTKVKPGNTAANRFAHKRPPLGLKVSRGDVLVKVNHLSVRDVPYKVLLQQLRDGAKPVILTFQKSKKPKV
ncbi:myosin [Thraustotheca clavata]|uniref:Myosin n=1 Tax=Thraustotheca clavata TaxID=74557 RepID=A0A1V9YVW9_9STRA|nr:myosin [Thraustotheca clavata]